MSDASLSRSRRRWTIRATMLAVALGAVGLATWRTVRDYHDAERAWTSLQLRRLDAADPRERATAATELGRVPPAEVPRVVPALIPLLKDRDARVRRNAAASLGFAIARGAAVLASEIQPEVQAATLALLPCLEDGDPEVRRVAIEALLRFRDQDQGQRSNGPSRPRFGPDSTVVLPPLLRTTSDRNPQVRAVALQAVFELLPGGSEVSPVVIDAASAQNSEPAWTRERGGSRRLSADDVVFALARRALRDPDSQVRRVAIEPFTTRADPPLSALPELVELMAVDRSWSIRTRLGRAIQSYGEQGRPFLDRLAAIAREESDGLPYPVIRTVIAVDPMSAQARSFLEPLVEWMRFPRHETDRLESRDCLAGFGPRGLHSAFAEGDAETRRAASVALHEIEGDYSVGIPP